MTEPTPSGEPTPPNPPSNPPPSPPPSDDDPSKWDPERAKNTILAQRQAEKDLKEKLRLAEAENEAFKKEKKEKEEAELSEADRAKKEAEEAKAEAAKAKADLVEATIRGEVIKECNTLNIIDSDVALALLNREKIKLEDGKATGVKEALEALIKDKPYLVKPAPGSGGVPPLPPSKEGGPSKEQLEAASAATKSYIGRQF